MKTFLALFLGVFLLSGFSLKPFNKLMPDDFRHPDDPVGGLAVDARIDEKIKKFLTPLAREKAWFKLEEGEPVTSIYSVNLAKFPVKDYYGIKIERIEVRAEKAYNEEGLETGGEQVNSFIVFLEEPAKNTHELLLSKMEKVMGPILTTSYDEENFDPENPGPGSPNWFSDVTLMTVSGIGLAKTYAGKKYITVDYRKGYG